MKTSKQRCPEFVKPNAEVDGINVSKFLNFVANFGKRVLTLEIMSAVTISASSHLYQQLVQTPVALLQFESVDEGRPTSMNA